MEESSKKTSDCGIYNADGEPTQKLDKHNTVLISHELLTGVSFKKEELLVNEVLPEAIFPVIVTFAICVLGIYYHSYDKNFSLLLDITMWILCSIGIIHIIKPTILNFNRTCVFLSLFSGIGMALAIPFQDRPLKYIGGLLLLNLVFTGYLWRKKRGDQKATSE